MTMTCGQARRLLWPDAGPREATGEVVAAREHLSRCELCRRFLDDMRRLSERIRNAAPRPEAPVGVRDRLFKAIARARMADATRSATGGHRRWAVGVVATLIVGGAWLSLRLTGERPMWSEDALGAIAEDHLRSQQSGGLHSSDSLEVARWLADRLPFSVDVPIFPEARLEGARLLLVNRQAGAAVDYTIAGRSLGYYVLPISNPDRAARTREVRLAARAGYRIAAWDDAGLTHVLVAGLPESKLIELARYCMQQMMAAVAPKARGVQA
ncbi:MAG: hypothetical protein ACREOF_06480 [Gemmatimonadales bacterium]